MCLCIQAYASMPTRVAVSLARWTQSPGDPQVLQGASKLAPWHGDHTQAAILRHRSVSRPAAVRACAFGGAGNIYNRLELRQCTCKPRMQRCAMELHMGNLACAPV